MERFLKLQIFLSNCASERKNRTAGVRETAVQSGKSFATDRKFFAAVKPQMTDGSSQNEAAKKGNKIEGSQQKGTKRQK